MAEMPGDGATPAVAPKGRSPLVLILVTAVLVGPLAIGGFMMLNKGKAPKAGAEKQTKEAKSEKADKEADEEIADGEIATWPLAVQTVNLADGDRYCRVKLELAFELEEVDAEYFRGEVAKLSSDKEGGGGEGEKKKGKEPSKKVQRLAKLLTAQQSRLNDQLIEELSAKRYEEMLKPAARQEFKKLMMQRYNAVLTESKVTVHDIYLSEFVMQ